MIRNWIKSHDSEFHALGYQVSKYSSCLSFILFFFLLKKFHVLNTSSPENPKRETPSDEISSCFISYFIFEIYCDITVKILRTKKLLSINFNHNYYIYISKVKLTTLVEGDLKAPFSIATTSRCREGRYSIPWFAPLYPWSLPYNAEC